MTLDELASLAAELGSDIPFFLYGGPAVCRGRGEIIEPVVGLGALHFVVAKPPAGLSTADVYRACRPSSGPRRVAGLLDALRQGLLAGAAGHLHNALQAAAETLSPWIARLSREFGQLDFLGHRMSGSGTSYFGLCRHARHARRLAAYLRCSWRRARLRRSRNLLTERRRTAVEITEVRIKLMEDAGERLQGFCSITFDHCFVVRDLKIIEGTNRAVRGHAQPQADRALLRSCGSKNHLRAAYCNQCGQRLKDDRVAKDDDGRAKLYADIAHPINSACREMIQEAVIRAFRDEVERSKLPGYVPSYDDFDDFEAERPVKRPKPASREAAAEKTRLEPAQTSHTPPHTVPVQPAVSNSNKHGAFGAGIW